MLTETGHLILRIAVVIAALGVSYAAIDYSNRRYAARREADEREFEACERRCKPNLGELIEGKCWCDRSLEPAH